MDPFIPFFDGRKIRKTIADGLYFRGRIVIFLWSFPLELSSGAFLVLYRCKLSIRNTEHHLYYDLDIPFGNELLFAALYLTATTVAPLISEIVRMRFVGALILTSFMASKFMFSRAVISVWCYFAAVISAIIYTVTHRHPATVAR